MYEVYILESLNKLNRHYVGHTSDLNVRLQRHNEGLVRSTKAYAPWKIIHTEFFESRSEAYKREMQIKSMKSIEYIKSLINKQS